MSASGDPARQRRFYEEREHAHLRPREGDFYADKLVDVLVRGAGLGSSDRVLEVGAGFGRFTFPLLRRCASVTALDLAPSVLAELEQDRDRRGIPAARCRPLCADVSALEPDAVGERFGGVVGFFVLHHLPDFADAIARLARLLEPGGAMAFVEPNRRNPLFLAQVACCPDMSWAEEKGMFRFRARRAEEALRRAGLVVARTRRFGFFPPQLVNRFEAARRLEARLEAMALLEPVLPFVLVSGRTPSG